MSNKIECFCTIAQKFLPLVETQQNQNNYGYAKKKQIV